MKLDMMFLSIVNKISPDIVHLHVIIDRMK